MDGPLVAAASTVIAAVCTAVTIRMMGRDRIRRRAGVGLAVRGSTTRNRWRSIVPVVGVAATGWWIGRTAGLVVALGAAAIAPRVAERRRTTRRAEAVDEQLSDAVASIAAGLRAGMSVLTSIGRAADDVDEPVTASLRQIVARASLGMPLGESLARFPADVGSPSARLVATALALQHRHGGDGPTVLDRLAGTLRHRAEGEREIRSLTAQARLSGTILGVLPVAFFLFLLMTSRDDLIAAYRSPAGTTAIVAGFLMQGTAFLWIRRLLRVEA